MGSILAIKQTHGTSYFQAMENMISHDFQIGKNSRSSLNQIGKTTPGREKLQIGRKNEKQQIASLTDAEIAAATAISKLFKTYKWNKINL